MLTRLIGALALIASFPAVVAAQEQQWKASFIPGAVEPGGNVLHATEVRSFATFGSPIRIYAGTSGWLDQAPDAADRGSAQIIRLDASDAPWRLEVDFNTLCPTPSKCALAVGALRAIQWRKTESGTGVNVWTLVASNWPTGPKPQLQSVYVKNNSDGKWYATTLNSANSDVGHIRVFDTHQDAVTGQFWGFAGGNPALYRGQLSNNRGAGQNIIHWTTGIANAEADFTPMDATETNCIHGARVMGLQEARGKEFLAVCYHIYQRVDGDQGDCKVSEVKNENKCDPRWIRFWSEPGAGTGEGLRGLTTVTVDGKQELLVIDESAKARVWRINPDTAAATVELDLAAFVEANWGMHIGYIIAGYNSPLPIVYDANGVGRRIIGMETQITGPLIPGHSKVMTDEGKGDQEGDGWFLVRNAPAAYKLFHIPAILPQTLMLSVRDAIASPFADETGWIYFGGFDGNGSSQQTPCRAEPCDPARMPAVPTHDTGWIVKGRPLGQ